jgi:hypothetical protein
MILLLLEFALVSCRSPVGDKTKIGKESTVNLAFHIDLNEKIYESTPYGNPPQMAIWLRNQEDGSVRTVMVTYRMGAGDWKGKTTCSICLPYWISCHNRQTGASGPPTREHPVPDAITYATPKDQLIVNTSVPKGTRWRYFIEVNVSGDFNTDFPKQSSDGRSDRDGNGQPSVVYGGTIEAVSGMTSKPVVLGRTDQYEPVVKLTKNTEGITTALELLSTLTVSCQ